MDIVHRIEEAAGIKMNILDPEKEALYGVYGVLCFLESYDGFVLDIGGGSCQLSYVQYANSRLYFEPFCVSLPFGAATLSRRLDAESQTVLYNDMIHQLKEAASDFPEFSSLGSKPLICCGGGSRGIGYVLMSKDPIQPYPFADIDGYVKGFDDVINIANDIMSLSDCQKQPHDFLKMANISKHRAKQAPAVALLFKSLKEIGLPVSSVTFSKGGVPYGILFENIPESSMELTPLDSFFNSAQLPTNATIEELMSQATPSFIPASFAPIIKILSRSLYLFQGESKMLAPIMGLAATITGIFADITGLTHREKAIISIALCERFGRVKNNLQLKVMETIAGPEGSLYGLYFGKIMALLGWFYPSLESASELRIAFKVVYKRSQKSQRSWICQVQSKNFDLSDSVIREIFKTSESDLFEISAV